MQALAGADGGARALRIVSERYADVDCVRPLAAHGGETLLMLAVAARAPALVRLLLRLGADGACRSPLPPAHTPLLLAVSQGDVATASALLQHDASLARHALSPALGAKTALHVAAANGDCECLALMLRACRDVNALAASGLAALHYAAAHGRRDAVALLLNEQATNADAVVQPAMPDQPGAGATALHLAAVRGHADVAELLLLSGRVKWVDARDVTGASALHAALAVQQPTREVLRAARALVVLGRADVARADAVGQSALARAFALGARLVRQASADTPADAPPAGAAQISDVATLICAMLRHKPDVNAPLAPGRSMLGEAVRWCEPELVRALLRAGAMPDSRALCAAAKAGRVEESVCMLEALPHPTDRSLRTPLSPLHAAAAVGATNVLLAYLARYGWAPDDRDAAGRTPLMYAARAGHAAAVRLLLEAGADAGLRDGDGEGAQAHAVGGGHAALAEMLARAPPRVAPQPVVESQAQSSPAVEVGAANVAGHAASGSYESYSDGELAGNGQGAGGLADGSGGGGGGEDDCEDDDDPFVAAERVSSVRATVRR